MKNPMRSTLAAIALLLVAACAATDQTGSGMAAVNTRCPMSGEPIEGGGPTTTFKGAKIEFCCEKCVTGWNKLDDGKKQEKLDAAK